MTTTTPRPARTLARFALAAACLGVASTPLLSPAPAAAAVLMQARELRVNVQPGTTFTFGQEADFEFDMKLAMGEATMDMTMAGQDSIRGRAEVLEVDGQGRPTKVRMTFDEGLGTAVTAMGQQQNEPFALAGQTVTATLTPGGAGGAGGVTLDVPADEEVKTKVRTAIEFGRDLLPEGPVNVGDSWPAKANVTGALGGGGDAAGTVTLVGYRQVGGREAAELRYVVDLDTDLDGMAGKGNISGTLLADTQTGLLLGGQLDGDLNVSGDNFNGAQAQVSGDLDLTLNYSGSVNGGGAGAGAAAEVAAGDPASPFPSPATPPPAPSADAPTPAAPTPPAAPVGDLLTGEYEGDGLKLIVADPAGSTYPITLIKGDATYQGTITSTVGDSFSGSFTAGGNPFPFSGTRTPTGLSFQTGTSTYNLTGGNADEPANPL